MLQIAFLKSYSGHNYILTFKYDRSVILDKCRVAQISFSHAWSDLSGIKCLPLRNNPSFYHPHFIGAFDMAFVQKAIVSVSGCFGLLAIGFIGYLFITVENSNDVDCVSWLEIEGYEFTTLNGFNIGKCQIDTPVRITSLPHTSMNKPITLSCPFARKVGKWSEEIGANHLEHVGGYNCRKISGSLMMSQHSFGNAIDVVSVNNVDLGKNYRQLSAAACKHFTNVFGPDDDAAHSHHLHLDSGPGIGCGPRKFLKSLLR